MAEDITRLLLEWAKGDKDALAELMPMVYQELHRIATRYLNHENRHHTLQPTELIHEAYLRIIDQNRVNWQDRAHFYAIAARMMRRILINYALAKQAAKRGGNDLVTLAYNEEIGPLDQNDIGQKDIDILALDDALKNLAAKDERKSQLVELRFFSGLTLEEAAEAMGISLTTAKRDWRLAKAWLYREIKGEPGDEL